MPAGKRQQGAGIMYTAITFVVLFLIAAIIAGVFYVQSEKQRKNTETLTTEMNTFATVAQRTNKGNTVGDVPPRETVMGTLLNYLDSMVYMIIGGVPEETSAQIKVESAKNKFNQAVASLTRQHLAPQDIDPNTTGLIRILEMATLKLDQTTESLAASRKDLDDLQKRFDDAVAANAETQQRLIAEKDKYYQQVQDVTKAYEDLKTQLEMTTDQQVKLVRDQLDAEKANSDSLRDQLLRTQAELKMIQGRLDRAQGDLQSIVPQPDMDVLAYKPDGKIMLVDNQLNVVHLNVGRKDKVYRGLTFAVYDKNAPIPPDGKGKAEVEVFDVQDDFSVARIVKAEIRRPIVADDVVANLIWDSDKRNLFVVAGNFTQEDAPEGELSITPDMIKLLITKWGGAVADEVGVNTDYLVLGTPPVTPRRPTLSQMNVFPDAMEKYEAAVKTAEAYQKAVASADTLGVPVFNKERFLNFIGYKEQSTKPGAFQTSVARTE